MSDGFDPCECVYNVQQAAMQRLLTLLRESQNYCTDNECTDELPLSNVAGPSPINYYMMALWALFAMFLFFMRPASMRRTDPGAEKPSAVDSTNSNNDDQPPPPAAH